MQDEKFWYQELKEQLKKSQEIESELFNLKQQNQQLQEKLDNVSNDFKNLQNELNHKSEMLFQVLNSHSWRYTSILRLGGNWTRKIKRIVGILIKEPKLIATTFRSLKKYGIRETVKKIKYKLSGVGDYAVITREDSSNINLMSQENVIILTSKHTNFIAELLKANLKKVGKKAKIVFAEEYDSANISDNELYFVICPNVFAQLPKHYVAFNLEQLISSRWFEEDKNYRTKLENSFALFDYSIKNIEILEDKYNFDYKQIYFMPISYHKDLWNFYKDTKEEYDVLFYGDDKNPRRQEILKVLSQHFKIKIINDTFKDELYRELAKAKLIINIHYYENALLETTRLYECLSLNRLVISEDSRDLGDYPDLEQCVDFVKSDDIDALIERINYWLKNEEVRKEKIAQNRVYLSKAANNFEYFFARFLLAQDWISFDNFYSLASKNVHFDKNFLCLTLPETPKRMKEFRNDAPMQIPFFYGLRHRIGYVGCGLSYKFMARKALELGLDYLTVCEDDVGFKDNFVNDYEQILSYLKDRTDWSMYNGLISELRSDAKISKIDGRFIHISDCVALVFCIYSKELLKYMAEIDNTNIKTDNMIDRYIQKYNNLKVITNFPFLVEHKADTQSTLWGKQNDVLYDDYFAKSFKDMQKKIVEYKKQIDM